MVVVVVVVVGVVVMDVLWPDAGEAASEISLVGKNSPLIWLYVV